MKRLIFVVALALLVSACNEVQKNETETAKNDTSLITKKKNYPTIKMLDTDFSKGRLGHIQEVELQDLARFHGHLCDGLIVGHLALKEALQRVYPEGFFERYMDKENLFAVPIAKILTIPMYSNASGILPVVQVLVAKGIPLGTAIAFMIGVVGLSLPEAMLLKKVM